MAPRKRPKTGGRRGGDACHSCHRTWDTPNPLKFNRGGSETLPRCKGYGPNCDVCVGTHRAYYKGSGVTMADINDKCSECGGEEHVTWMKHVTCYERKRNGENVHQGGDDVIASALGPQTFVEQEDQEEIVQTTVLSKSWPVAIYKKCFGKDPEPGEVQIGEDMNGNECDVVLRDPKLDTLPLPSGVTTVTKVRRKGAKRRRIADDSKDHIREGQGKDAWSHARGKLDLTVEPAGSVDDKQIPMTLSRTAKGDANNDDGGEDVGPSSSSGEDFVFLRGRKRERGDGGDRSSGTSGRHEAKVVPKAKPKPKAKTKESKASKGGKVPARKPSPPGSALAPRVSGAVPDWRVRQKAIREIQGAEKVIGPARTFVSHLLCDEVNCTFVEAVGFRGKLEARLALENRWVYNGEDLDPSQGDADKIRETRMALLVEMEELLVKLCKHCPVLQSLCASPKVADEYCVVNFKGVIIDFVDDGGTLSDDIVIKYLERFSKD